MTVTTESPSNGKSKRQRRAWTPDAKDHLIYQWVKFDGKTQLYTAVEFGISQATVSRIIDRYERWQAHADPREGGRLDPAERLRAQRWLTYERNERILASALRIADRMEGVTESWKSVKTRPLSEWHRDGTEIRSEEQSVDRHGVAARFLRLAFRINMEQLKLVQQDPPPIPRPLTEAELAAEEARDAAVAQDLAAAERRSAEQFAGIEAGPEESPAATEPDEAMLNLHKVHNGQEGEIAASADQPCTCDADRPIQKTEDDACIAGPAQENTNPTRKRGNVRREKRRAAALVGAIE